MSVPWPWPPGTIVVCVKSTNKHIPEGAYCTVVRTTSGINTFINNTLGVGTRHGIQVAEYPNIAPDHYWFAACFRPAESNHDERALAYSIAKGA